MFDPSRLSAESRTLLGKMAALDGKVADLSSVDLTHASQAHIDGLMASLKKDGYNGTEQELVTAILTLTRDTRSQQQYQAFQFKTGQVNSLAFAEQPRAEAVAKQPAVLTAGEVRDRVLRAGTVDKLALGHTNTYNSTSLNSDTKINAMLDARKALADRFGFKPSNPYDLQAIAAIRPKIPRHQVAEFMELYMTAHFVHSGKGTAWGGFVASDTVSKAMLFGDYDAMDQLPDGRRVVDCQGFSRIGEILLDTLVPGRDNGTVFYKSIRIPGHEMALFRDGKNLYVVDNNKVAKLKASEAEMTYLKAVLDRYNALDGTVPLDDLDIGRKSLPSLYAYVRAKYPTLKGTISWDDGDALVDG
jgi:hypothetical protein